jgi:hypothetical protein
MAPYPSGKGEVCKTFMHRFESDRRLLLDLLRLTFGFRLVKNGRISRHCSGNCSGALLAVFSFFSNSAICRAAFTFSDRVQRDIGKPGASNVAGPSFGVTR